MWWVTDRHNTVIIYNVAGLTLQNKQKDITSKVWPTNIKDLKLFLNLHIVIGNALNKKKSQRISWDCLIYDILITS